MIIPFKKSRTQLKNYAEHLSEDGFKQIFNHIDQLNIKKGVDRMGLDKFINQCAYLAAGSGAIAGSGGILTMIVGMPVDFVNLITQQFRVTMAITYYNKGSYKVSFEQFMTIVATSFKVEAGVAVTKTMMEGIAEKLLMMFGVRTAERLIPVVGAAIGGTTNYLFVKRMAESVKKLKLPDEPVIIQIS
ncbi:hypothetical protein [Mucilaginibacter segetis]|uniref:EcsC family protein n=1 Tax=Mucilaginibacter segetis TaxID=2793071 RepID=A0A934PT24_9SPHI|nr:hypothetical protein [Mucilaginibacter segetis]MBK0380299.1 hypothetical protein [Mucilaginibacter segetis]